MTRLGYMVPEFPGQTHAFFWREIVGLRHTWAYLSLVSTKEPDPAICPHAFGPKRLLKRCQAIEPLTGHTKADHRMERCWLQSAMGDALHALSCAAGYNICWLLRSIVRLGLRGPFYALSAVIACLAYLLQVMPVQTKAVELAKIPQRRPSARLTSSPLSARG